jgi:hypothetical protein
MTMFSVSGENHAMSRRPRRVGGWVGLAASPTLALMAWVTANHAPFSAFCSSGANFPPICSMSAMYLLMSVFHLSPWLEIACGRPSASNR